MKQLLSHIAITGLVLCAIAAPAHAKRFNASSPECGQSGKLPTSCGNIVFDGDSISAGVGATDGLSPDVQFMQDLHVLARVANVAAGGEPVSDCLRLFNNNVTPQFVPGARFNLIVFHAGDNDINQGRSAAQTYEAFTQYVAAAHAQGWKVLVSTEMQRLAFPPDKKAALDDYNRQLLANHAHADAVVNLATERRLTDPAAHSDPTLFIADKMHPTNAGYAILEHMQAAAALRLLPH